ncbi:acetyl-CoA carboxylase biotin carboxyl carrier protein [Oceanibacterium hippocampi]|uniref:Biotin carboxyl carrier protein of acetyl-CoA carboxylase n=1 Tax=Oceanibacterium hippocampi TaxID=745714 RepID=A0A1Y5SZW7_9PROT|nr:acetyl-CoA carboxylase biotin carboxyl carrier protein [Oceanibacterium hippocampi]SLN48852.1 Biotin carboxyl carrier protein of acetyl-CoA carboxylase [Oceanibacterium hippocampi]
MSKGKIDTDAIRELAGLLHETGLGEIEWEDETTRIRVSLGTSQSAQAAAVPVAAAPAAAPAPAAAAAATDSDPKNHPGAVTSPMVGTAYLSPEPGVGAFVRVGDSVTKGQTLLIVEAMKTMNPIPAPTSGTLSRILVSNEEPVEFGQTLMIIE